MERLWNQKVYLPFLSRPLDAIQFDAPNCRKKDRLDGGESSLSRTSRGKETSRWTRQPDPLY